MGGIHSWDEWSTAVCLAYSYITEVGTDAASPDEFGRWIVGQFPKSPPRRWQEAHEKVKDLFLKGQEHQLVGLGCDALDYYGQAT
jgi:hypothetical protein